MKYSIQSDLKNGFKFKRPVVTYHKAAGTIKNSMSKLKASENYKI
jgi:hypothetical protein